MIVEGFGFRFSVFGFRFSGFGFRVSGFGFRVSGLGSQVSGSDFGFRVSGFGFRVEGGVVDDPSGRRPRRKSRAMAPPAPASQGYLAHKKPPTPLGPLQENLARKKRPDPLGPLEGYLAHKKTPTPLWFRPCVESDGPVRTRVSDYRFTLLIRKQPPP